MSEQDGEKELILGNRQLISLFFVVVALCGVFFALGYMVRGNALRNPAPTSEESASVSSPGPTVKRQQPEPPRETLSEMADGATADPAPSDTTPATQPAPRTSLAESRPTTRPESAPPPASFTEAKRFQPAEAKPAASDAEGTYVQVAALSRPDAEATLRTLREQHFPASIAPSSKEGLFRVRVGPYHQVSDVADAKARLKVLGFSNTIVQKQ